MENAQDMFVNANDFKANNVYYAKPRTNPSGGKNVGIMDSSIKKPLVISVPLMLTWGVNEWIAEDTGKKSYDLSLQFPREDDGNYDKCKNFLKSLQEFEKKLLQDALKNSKEWFGKKYELAPVVEALFTPMLRYPKNESGDPDMTRMPSLRVKLPYWEGKFNCELYDLSENTIFPDVEDDSLTPVSLISKGQKIASIIKCGGIWFANGKFGVTWKLVQAVVQPRITLRGKCHIKLDTNERVELEENSKRVENEEEDDEESVPTQVENTDDEEEPAPTQEETPEPTPEPAKEEAKPKKKRVVKKKATK
jgi:hypothetical protein